MTPDLLTEALTDHAHDVSARPTLAADARRGARRRQRQARAIGGTLALLAVSGTVLIPNASVLGGPDPQQKLEPPPASGLVEHPYRGPLDDRMYRFTAPRPGDRAALPASEALAVFQAQLRGAEPLTDDHVVEASFGLVQGVPPGVRPTSMTPAWRIVVHGLEARPGQTCDFVVYLSGATGKPVSNLGSRC